MKSYMRFLIHSLSLTLTVNHFHTLYYFFSVVFLRFFTISARNRLIILPSSGNRRQEEFSIREARPKPNLSTTTMMRLTSFALLLSAMAVGVSGLGTDYIDEAPATVYEATEMSPQNMDFDAANNMFVAHSGWYNDQLIHYYKFRIFAPDTYPGTFRFVRFCIVSFRFVSFSFHTRVAS